jgi:hypothetical protein
MNLCFHFFSFEQEQLAVCIVSESLTAPDRVTVVKIGTSASAPPVIEANPTLSK